MGFNKLIQNYYYLAKPGIIYGNLLTAVAGYLFASHWNNHYQTLLAMLVGLGLIIGCGCVLNNVIDRELDKNMERTKKRSIVTGNISINSAIIYGLCLGLIGSIVLIKYTSELCYLVAIFGLISYLGFYGFAKRRSIYGTLVGSLAGAVPPLVGYVSVTHYIDLAGLILVLILVCWQMAHFYAISLYRKSDYQAAKLPVWSVIKGDKSTKIQILGFIVLFWMFSVSLFILGLCGFIYLAIVSLLSLAWLVSAINSNHKLQPKDWGRKVFLNSLIVICLTCLALAIGPITL